MISPWHDVRMPLQVPSDWQRLTVDPFKMNPSSQLKVASLGKVVSRPLREPFWGTVRLPQSLAVRKQRAHSFIALTRCQNAKFVWLKCTKVIGIVPLGYVTHNWRAKQCMSKACYKSFPERTGNNISQFPSDILSFHFFVTLLCSK